MYFDSIPNSGGMKVLPTYALAICIPMTAWEFSLPKLSGVEWIIAGYIGAQPNPVTISPIFAGSDVSAGSMMPMIPTASVIIPIRIIRLSPMRSETKPQRNRPPVIPR